MMKPYRDIATYAISPGLLKQSYFLQFSSYFYTIFCLAQSCCSRVTTKLLINNSFVRLSRQDYRYKQLIWESHIFVVKILRGLLGEYKQIEKS